MEGGVVMGARGVLEAASVGLVAAIGSAFVLAGDLDPPAGAVAPTMKDLDDVEARTVIRNDPGGAPIVISVPGSYVLGEDIQGLGGQHGITIDADDVTLDLNGFTVRGDLQIGSINGIHVEPDPGPQDRANITIRNGVVRDFGENGIQTSLSKNGVIEDIKAHHNGLGSNGGVGIFAWQGYVVRDCVAFDNRKGNSLSLLGSGIVTSHGCIISGCATIENERTGISAGVGSVVIGCVARNNMEDGISGGVTCVFADCSADNNTGRGIDATQFSVVRGCVTRNNGSHGIEGLNECTITNSVASANGGDGINATNSLVRGNVASGNTGMNINAMGGTTVLENHQ